MVGDGSTSTPSEPRAATFAGEARDAAEDEEVVALRGADELRGERDAEVGVEDDAKEWAAAG